MKIFVLLLCISSIFCSCVKDPEPCFDFEIDDTWTVPFNSDCSENGDAWEWDFGDGGTSIAANPVHEYEEGGSYLVTLRLTNDAGATTITKTVVLETHYRQCICKNSFGGEGVYGMGGSARDAERWCEFCEEERTDAYGDPCRCVEP